MELLLSSTIVALVLPKTSENIEMSSSVVAGTSLDAASAGPAVTVAWGTAT